MAKPHTPRSLEALRASLRMAKDAGVREAGVILGITGPAMHKRVRRRGWAAAMTIGWSAMILINAKKENSC